MNKAFCTQEFKTETGTVKNSYLCGQPHFTTASMWNILKQKKEVTLRRLSQKG